MEMSHRSREFEGIHNEALADLRELLQVPKNFRILFLQGGAIGENGIVPLNLASRINAAAEDRFRRHRHVVRQDRAGSASLQRSQHRGFEPGPEVAQDPGCGIVEAVGRCRVRAPVHQ
jgi:hypothetical protein